jgi:hypothetical protein
VGCRLVPPRRETPRWDAVDAMPDLTQRLTASPPGPDLYLVFYRHARSSHALHDPSDHPSRCIDPLNSPPYASEDYQAVLDAHGIICSMSRRGNCYDNAVMESFFSSVKSEVADRFASCGEAKMELFDYIEVFDNQPRRHTTLGYVSPAAYERNGRYPVRQVVRSPARSASATWSVHP